MSADVVTADGQRLHVDDRENSDLFWAIRGGGGNFGVVTRFELKLHLVGPNVVAGMMVFPIEQAEDLLKKYREFIESAPADLNVWVVLRSAPPLPFLPAAVHGQPVLVFVVFYAGDYDKAHRAIEPLRHFGPVPWEHIDSQ